MFAVLDLLREIGTIAGAVAAVIGCAILVAKLRPVRWLAHTLLGEPVRRAFRHEVGEVLDEKLTPIRHELQFNSGHSLKDAVWTIARHTAAPVPPEQHVEGEGA